MRPSPYAGEGIYDWLRHREPRWASLAIIHRLDKETSGVLVFSKTPLANRSLTEQFTERGVQKKYLLLTDRPGHQKRVRGQERTGPRGRKIREPAPIAAAESAETRFRNADGEMLNSEVHAARVLEAEPLTGARTRSGCTPPKRFPDSGRHTLRRHPRGARLSARRRTYAATSGFRRGTDLSPPAAPTGWSLSSPLRQQLPQLAAGAGPLPRLGPARRPDRLRRRPTLIGSSTARAMAGRAGTWTDWANSCFRKARSPLRLHSARNWSDWQSAFSARGAYHKILTRQVRPRPPPRPRPTGAGRGRAGAVHRSGKRAVASS